eukprot:TRINITY_DN10910_c0_g1_i1.p2 TRINITY_DN10910_c0_g1~~TRINITY_DN10910_c0_g1_i1.p2  ORF type:complete len:273 (+),score=65.96 TRINITY_DN10910_c0_g1_i1:50-820(+)
MSMSTPTLVGLLVALLLLSSASAALIQSAPKTLAPEVSFCNICVEEVVAEINIILNEVLNEGIRGDCSLLCSYLKNAYEQDACIVGCDSLGIYEFIKWLESTDIDPIYYCEYIDGCPIDDCEGDCMDITSFVLNPKKIPAGDVLSGVITLDIKKEWVGTGMFTLAIQGPNVSNSQDSLLSPGIGPVGVNSLPLSIATKGMHDGNYMVTALICNGQCGSDYPHSRIFAKASANFTVSGVSSNPPPSPSPSPEVMDLE